MTTARHQVYKRGYALWVHNGHVEHLREHIAHGFHGNAYARAFGLEQVLVGRFLLGVFLGGETGALYKADHRGGNEAEFFARFARGFQVLLQGGAATALHEGEV